MKKKVIQSKLINYLVSLLKSKKNINKNSISIKEGNSFSLNDELNAQKLEIQNLKVRIKFP
jgi:hypothetical protein